jgi:hypothetical protein
LSHPRHPQKGFLESANESMHPPPQFPHTSNRMPLSNTPSHPRHCLLLRVRGHGDESQKFLAPFADWCDVPLLILSATCPFHESSCNHEGMCNTNEVLVGIPHPGTSSTQRCSILHQAQAGDDARGLPATASPCCRRTTPPPIALTSSSSSRPCPSPCHWALIPILLPAERRPSKAVHDASSCLA